MVEVLARTIDRTAEEMADFTPTQRVGAVLACAVTGTRLAAPFFIRKNPNQPWTWEDTRIRTLVASTDPIDGWVARSLRGCTELGALGDSIADKVVMLRHEKELWERGQLSLAQFVTRTIRDVVVTKERLAAHNDREGHIDIRANRVGKASTVVRSAADLFSASPVGERLPRISRVLQSVATGAVVASGGYNVWQLRQAKSNTEQT